MQFVRAESCASRGAERSWRPFPEFDPQRTKTMTAAVIGARSVSIHETRRRSVDNPGRAHGGGQPRGVCHEWATEKRRWAAMIENSILKKNRQGLKALVL